MRANISVEYGDSPRLLINGERVCLFISDDKTDGWMDAKVQARYEVEGSCVRSSGGICMYY